MVYKKTITRRASVRRVKRVTYKPKGNLVALIKKVSLKQAETKHSSRQAAGISLFHNKTLYLSNLLRTTVGVGSVDNESGFGTNGAEMNGHRIGDEIIVKGLSLRFHHECAPTRPNSICKVFVFWYRANDILQDARFWCGIDGAGLNMQRMVDAPNSDKIRIIKSFIIQHQPNYDGTTTAATNGNFSVLNRCCATYRQIWIPLKSKKIRYDQDNGNIPKWKDIGVAVLNCDLNGTLETDRVGYLNWSARLYFKDP